MNLSQPVIQLLQDVSVAWIYHARFRENTVIDIVGDVLTKVWYDIKKLGENENVMQLKKTVDVYLGFFITSKWGGNLSPFWEFLQKQFSFRLQQ